MAGIHAFHQLSNWWLFFCMIDANYANDYAYSSWYHTHENLIVLSIYAISCQSDVWNLKNDKNLIFNWASYKANKATYVETMLTDPELLDMQYLADSTTRSPGDGQNPSFSLFGSFRNAFLWFRIILQDLVTLPNVEKCLVLMPYATSSRFSRQKSLTRPKTCFLTLRIIQKCIFCDF